MENVVIKVVMMKINKKCRCKCNRISEVVVKLYVYFVTYSSCRLKETE